LLSDNCSGSKHAYWTGLEPVRLRRMTTMYANQLNYRTNIFNNLQVLTSLLSDNCSGSKHAYWTGLEPVRLRRMTTMYANQLNYRTKNFNKLTATSLILYQRYTDLPLFLRTANIDKKLSSQATQS